MRLGLAAEGYAGVNVLPVVGVNMINRSAERFLTKERGLAMETVHGMAPCPVPIPLLGIADKRIVEFFLEHPRGVEVVFHSGSVNGCAGGLSVNKKHVVALTPPSSREP